MKGLIKVLGANSFHSHAHRSRWSSMMHEGQNINQTFPVTSTITTLKVLNDNEHRSGLQIKTGLQIKHI